MQSRREAAVVRRFLEIIASTNRVVSWRDVSDHTVLCVPLWRPFLFGQLSNEGTDLHPLFFGQLSNGSASWSVVDWEWDILDRGRDIGGCRDGGAGVLRPAD
jgi:hypothetical protein